MNIERKAWFTPEEVAHLAGVTVGDVFERFAEHLAPALSPQVPFALHYIPRRPIRVPLAAVIRWLEPESVQAVEWSTDKEDRPIPPPPGSDGCPSGTCSWRNGVGIADRDTDSA